MPESRKTTAKQIAERIDPVYFRSWHRLRKLRFLLSLGFCVVAAVWVAGAAMLGDATIYSAGPVSAAHAVFGAACAKCHTHGFATVQDAACTACHTVGAHTEANDPDCAACHAEHRPDAPAPLFCAGCHADHKGIRNFEDHLGFQPKIHQQKLRFSHAAHLNPAHSLSCASCHRSDGPGFAPIRFAGHCASCHTERIDADLKDTVPHGVQPDALRDWIAAVYLRRLGVMDGESQPGLVGKGGKPPAWTEELRRRTDTALGALVRPGAGCMLCHIGAKGVITPPDIPVRWLSKAGFDHRAHRTQSCARCHDVARNDAAQTLSLPGIRSCQECHKPGGARDSCVTCHGFHHR